MRADQQQESSWAGEWSWELLGYRPEASLRTALPFHRTSFCFIPCVLPFLFFSERDELPVQFIKLLLIHSLLNKKSLMLLLPCCGRAAPITKPFRPHWFSINERGSEQSEEAAQQQQAKQINFLFSFIKNKVNFNLLCVDGLKKYYNSKLII